MRFFLRSVFITLSLIFTTSVFATDYVFTGNGDWNNPDNWVGGVIPPEELPEGSTITILGTTALGLPCAPNEECEGSDPMWRNEGTIIISSGGALRLQNYTQFSHEGSIMVNGTLVNKTTLEVYEGSNIEVNGILRNESWIGNQGLITINNGGFVENLSGTLDNIL